MTVSIPWTLFSCSFAGRSSCLYLRMSFRDVMFPASSCLMRLYCHAATVRILLTGQSEKAISWWLMLKWPNISRLSVISLCKSAGLCRYQCARTQNPSAWTRFLWGLLRDFQPGGGWERYRPVRSAPETLANTHTSANAVLMLRSHLWLLFYRCGGLQRQSCGTEVDLHWTNSYLYSGRVKLSKRDIKDI